MSSPDHVSAISKLIRTISKSSQMHALIVTGPAGWGKTHAVECALRASKIEAAHLGSYSTPLHFFNFLYLNADQFILVDDCAGLFSDQSSMALLKAAAWPRGGRRIMTWGSTSSRADTDEFEFTGKLIIVCNHFPETPDANAVSSRSYTRKIDINVEEAKRLLAAAASDKKWFRNVKLATEVSDFLCGRLSEANLHQVSYRMLIRGYDLAEHNPDDWETLFSDMIKLPPEDPKKLIKKLSRQNIKVKEQARIFEEETGFKRRTFFKYRKELNLT